MFIAKKSVFENFYREDALSKILSFKGNQVQNTREAVLYLIILKT